MTGRPDPWGPEPTDVQLAAARASAQAAEADARRAALAGALTVERAGEVIGLSATALRQRVAAGELLALDDGRELRLPAWQFTGKGELPGLREVVAAWPGTALALSLFAVRPTPDLAGRTPAQELARRGGLRRVLALIEAISPAAC